MFAAMAWVPHQPCPTRTSPPPCAQTSLVFLTPSLDGAQVCAEEENQRCFEEEKRKTARVTTVRSKLWTTTGARPDLEEISADPQYKPKYTISSFFTQHVSASDTSQPIVPDDRPTPEPEQPPPAVRRGVGVVGRRRLNFWSLAPRFGRAKKYVQYINRIRGRVTV